MTETLHPDPERVSIDAASRTGEVGEHGQGNDVSTLVRSTGPPPPKRPGLRPRTALVIGVAVVMIAAVAVTAFALTSGDDQPQVVIDRDPIPTTQPMTEEQRVADAVRKFFTYRDQAAAIPDPDFALLTVHATGAELAHDIEAIRQLRDQGQATSKPPNTITETRVKVVSIEGDKARVEVCSISDGIVVDAATRKPVHDYPPGFIETISYAPELVQEFGTWKVTFLNRQGRWEGVEGCAVDS